MNVTAERHTGWDSFRLGKHEADLGDLNDTATYRAERALERDPRNLMAHAILARQFLVAEQPEAAEEAWRRTLDGGAALVWSAPLYDVDARTYFVMAFDRTAIRVYRFGQLAGAYMKRFGGIPEFPGPENDRFWASVAGCPDPAVMRASRGPTCGRSGPAIGSYGSS